MSEQSVRDWIDGKLTVTHFAMTVLTTLISVDILNQTGPVMGSFIGDIAIIGIFVILMVMNKKQDNSQESTLKDIESRAFESLAIPDPILVTRIKNAALKQLLREFEEKESTEEEEARDD